MSVDQNAKYSRRFLVGLVGLLFALLSAAGAAATATVSTYGSTVETICDGDCAKRSNLETRRMAAGFDLPFELGLKGVEDGLDLTIESDGNIFIYGLLNDTLNPFTSITLEAKDVVILSDAVIRAGRFDLSLPPNVGVPDISGTTLICECLSIVGDFGVDLTTAGLVDLEATLTAAPIVLPAGDLLIASLVGLDAPLAPPPGIAISRAGDIYLDLSMVGNGRLTATAGKSLYIVGSDSLPVPEPGTGLLLGLGLVSLAIRRARPSTSAAPLAPL